MKTGPSPLPDDWQLIRHEPGSDYGDNAYTLWPYGTILKGLPEPAARALDRLPTLRSTLERLACDAAGDQADPRIRDRTLEAVAAAVAVLAELEEPEAARYVIRSTEEAAAYWSNELGWTVLLGATRFTAAERGELRLPMGGRWAPLRPYSVLLRYPDWANDGGNETFYTFVAADDTAAAVAEARRAALAANEWTDTDPADFAVLLVTEGHHRGCATDGL